MRPGHTAFRQLTTRRATSPRERARSASACKIPAAASSWTASTRSHPTRPRSVLTVIHYTERPFTSFHRPHVLFIPFPAPVTALHRPSRSSPSLPSTILPFTPLHAPSPPVRSRIALAAARLCPRLLRRNRRRRARPAAPPADGGSLGAVRGRCVAAT